MHATTPAVASACQARAAWRCMLPHTVLFVLPVGAVCVGAASLAGTRPSGFRKQRMQASRRLCSCSIEAVLLQHAAAPYRSVSSCCRCYYWCA
ncbi:hypothetical protein COO60DRAFT_199082 [Scenedesmus sp. NREL 46B-D3]|nr:hypothetical protein COO60DRAFT_199082 [Scenedesmus sp. NREL 46B-D3]